MRKNKKPENKETKKREEVISPHYIKIDSLVKNLKVFLKKCLDEGNKSSIVLPDIFFAIEDLIDDLIQWIIPLLDHKDDLVRSSAIDTLSLFKPEAEFEKLFIKKLFDKSEMVRSSAEIALSQFRSKENIQILKKLLPRSKLSEAISIYYALIQMGDEKFVSHFLKGLSSNDYTVRCATANLATNFANKSFKKIIIKKLKDHALTEKSIAAKESINDAIDVLVGRNSSNAVKK